MLNKINQKKSILGICFGAPCLLLRIVIQVKVITGERK
jgi:hypothetical protein